ncbi:hypothetical protein PF005_g2785 [Phytophthora fragariae]|uniref:Uncharacterized protein n=1 Tax=Phytophthora fragariae TaxID=53985 RepID=A0A6A4EPZ5_9STRA|nr:hypothetical protein PF009_g3110 [Phytophthora fragariae]KAE9027565.1 hypothetical protein PF011_g1999 [Phytophthora fragariae]KAE9134316.1 hypothetical protein PF010_g2501 [Phytophthora fragariae]KAE9134960.1 hypothetical protein PF007_g2740 [Phytophthora fragariae]KAE9153484.1 hypothetical protein PF006_g2397 [Phytophthora fragariae]
MRRALLSLRPQARRGLLPAGRQLTPSAASRGFASPSSSAQAPSKWPKRLLIGVSVLAAAKYLVHAQEAPEKKECRRLLLLGKDCVEKGDVNQATSLPTAIKSLKAVHPISARYVAGVKLMDWMGECYHHLGRYEPAEKLFKKAIRLYEKYHNELPDQDPSRSSKRVVAALDMDVSNVFLHYAQLMVSLERDSEASLMRKRLVELVRSSPVMQIQEANTLDQFDDLMALHAIRKERRRKRGERHDSSF